MADTGIGKAPAPCCIMHIIHEVYNIGVIIHYEVCIFTYLYVVYFVISRPRLKDGYCLSHFSTRLSLWLVHLPVMSIDVA